MNQITNINNYLDSTYLKTTEQAEITEGETLEIINNLIGEAIDHQIFAVMIRPEYLSVARQQLNQTKTKVKLGTVIDFPMGIGELNSKLTQAQKAIKEGADELDFVIDYTAFKQGKIEKVSDEVLKCTRLCLSHNKIVKWIIETAALTDEEITSITILIKNIVLNDLSEFSPDNVYVKSSTGFYVTKNGEPNGANKHVIDLMVKNSNPLPVKASGGIRTLKDALQMIELGVKRIGTSSALAIVNNK